MTSNSGDGSTLLSTGQFSMLFQIVKEFVNLEQAVNRVEPQIDRAKLTSGLREVRALLEGSSVGKVPLVEFEPNVTSVAQVVAGENGVLFVVVHGPSKFFNAIKVEIEDAIGLLGCRELFLRTGFTWEEYNLLLLELIPRREGGPEMEPV